MTPPPTAPVPSINFEIVERLARIEANVKNTREDVTEVKDDVGGVKADVRGLRESRARDKGFIAALAVMIPVVTGVITALAIKAVGG